MNCLFQVLGDNGKFIADNTVFFTRCFNLVPFSPSLSLVSEATCFSNPVTFPFRNLLPPEALPFRKRFPICFLFAAISSFAFRSSFACLRSSSLF